MACSSIVCPLPWEHAYINMDGGIGLCCVAKRSVTQRHIDNTRLDEYLELPQLAHVRRQMMAGVWPPECIQCKSAEALGLASYRTGIIGRDPQRYAPLLADPASHQPHLRSVDIRISNRCNFKCRSCSVHFSHSWKADQIALYPHTAEVVNVDDNHAIRGIEEGDHFWQQLDGKLLQDIKEWHFAGGESLLIEQQYRLLDKLIEARLFDTKVTYTTNLSVLKHKGWDILEMLKPFSNVVFHISLDGVGEKGEFIRKGLIWDKFKSNLFRLREALPQALLDMHFVVSIYNVLDLQAHIAAIDELGIFFAEDGQQRRIGFTCLEDPAYLSIQSLSPSLKVIADERLAVFEQSLIHDHEMRSAVQGMRRFLVARDQYSQQQAEFKRASALLDARRRENTIALFPELEQM